MPSSPPLTPNAPTRGPESNLISTSAEEGTPYEAGYNTRSTGGPGAVIDSRSEDQQARDRMGTFGAGEREGAASGGKRSISAAGGK